jgi:hypothetical protein
MSRTKFEGAGEGVADTAFSPAAAGGCDGFIVTLILTQAERRAIWTGAKISSASQT